MIELVPLQMKDCEQVAEIASVSLPEHWSLKGIQDVLRYDDNIYSVARCTENGKIVGFSGIMVIWDEAELLNIAVHPEWRGRGIGQMLLSDMLRKAEEKGAMRLLLEVRKGNETAQSLYRKNLFSEIGERRNYYSNPTENAIIMERRFDQKEEII